MKQIKESWRPINGYLGKYEISNHGRVKSLKRQIGCGKGYSIEESIRINQKDSYGYCQISLPLPNRGMKSFKIHQLVASHFIRELREGEQVCHIDGNKQNNLITNLYIGNNISNTIDKYKQGRTKLSLAQLKEIWFSNDNQYFLAHKFGVAQSYISRIKRGTRGKMLHIKTTNTQVPMFATYDNEIKAVIVE